MRVSKVRSAISEARRFIERAEATLDHVEEFNGSVGEVTTHAQTNAAAKRASMDLTRALADMRRGIYG